jgi:hypothetical protein
MSLQIHKKWIRNNAVSGSLDKEVSRTTAFGSSETKPPCHPGGTTGGSKGHCLDSGRRSGVLGSCRKEQNGRLADEIKQAFITMPNARFLHFRGSREALAAENRHVFRFPEILRRASASLAANQPEIAVSANFSCPSGRRKGQSAVGPVPEEADKRIIDPLFATV